MLFIFVIYSVNKIPRTVFSFFRFLFANITFFAYFKCILFYVWLFEWSRELGVFGTQFLHQQWADTANSWWHQIEFNNESITAVCFHLNSFDLGHERLVSSQFLEVNAIIFVPRFLKWLNVYQWKRKDKLN